MSFEAEHGLVAEAKPQTGRFHGSVCMEYGAMCGNMQRFFGN